MIFFVLVFAAAVPFWALQALTDARLLPGLPLAALAILVPVTVAAALIFRSEGSRGVVRLLKRSVDASRVKSPIWYLPAILIPVLVAGLSLVLLRWIGVAVPDPLLPSPVGGVALLAVFLLAAWGEELGWMGYAYDPLEGRFGTVRASLILGVVWAVWHFVPLLEVGRSIEFIAWWTLGTVSMRIVMVWLYKGAGRSVFAVALCHAMSNLTWQLFPMQGSHFDPRIHGLILAGVAAGIVATWGAGLGLNDLGPAVDAKK